MNHVFDESALRVAADKKVFDFFGDGSDFESSLDRMWCSTDSLFQRVRNSNHEKSMLAPEFLKECTEAFPESPTPVSDAALEALDCDEGWSFPIKCLVLVEMAMATMRFATEFIESLDEKDTDRSNHLWVVMDNFEYFVIDPLVDLKTTILGCGADATVELPELCDEEFEGAVGICSDDSSDD